MKIVLLSFTDSSNFGDQLIVQQLMNTCQLYGDVTSYSYKFEKNSDFRNFDEGSPVGSKSIKSKIKNLYKSYFRNLYVFDQLHSYKNFYLIKKRIQQSTFLEDIKNSDVLIIGGGNTIFDLSKCSKTYKNYEYIVDLAKSYDRNVYMMSIGLGPFQNEDQKNGMLRVLQKCDQVTVRDIRSFSYVEEAKHVQLSIDPVFLIPNKKEVDMEGNIAICVIDYRLNNVSQNRYMKYLLGMRDLVNEIQSKFSEKTVVLFSSEPRDYEAVNDLYKLVENKNRLRVRSVTSKDDLITFYEELSIVLGTRMHSMIVAISQETPVVGISWQQKVAEMFRMMNDKGSSFEIENLSDEIDNIVYCIERKFENFDIEIERIKEFKKACIKKYEMNLKMLSREIDHE